jgi:peptide-methionine (S)-S-oxide reductase
METATFAAGCFWGVEAVFKKLEGVKETRVGYTGGSVEEPTYEEVCTGETGHAEAVEIKYNPAEISYEELLENFWANHDPTTLNREGVDVGTLYGSAIFYHTEEQKEKALESKEKLDNSACYQDPIVTEINPAGDFYEAEEYHQDYLEKQSGCLW